MSDERDETRSFSPFDDATWADDEAGPGRARSGDRGRRSSHTPGDRFRPQSSATPPDAGRVQSATAADATRPQAPEAEEATRLHTPGPADPAGSPPTTDRPGDSARSRPAADEAARVQPPVVDEPTRAQPPADAPTVVDGPGAHRPLDATSVMPAAGANPAWSGRAEVRPPQPGRTVYEREVEWPAGPDTGQRDRWWMPIAAGTLVLVLLAALAWGIYRILQDPGKNANTPAPAVTTSALPAPTTAPTAQTQPSNTPTTSTPDPAESTTESTDDAVAVPALRGLTVAEAKSALHEVGFDSTRVIYRPSGAEPDTVIASDPTEGQEVPADTTVTLVVAAPATAGASATGTGG